MLSALKKTTFCMLILLILPVISYSLNWYWQPSSLSNLSFFLFLITETASFPWAILTCIAFFLLFCWLTPIKTKKHRVLLWVVLVFAILFGQLVKTIAKSAIAKPRPYAMWMQQEYNVDAELFYSLDKQQKKMILEEHLYDSPAIPSWLLSHWKNETGYAFPSGHALFSSSWAFLALLILGFKRHPFIVSAFVVWAVLIDISRLALGMHYSVDLIGGTLLAWLVTLLSYLLMKNRFDFNGVVTKNTTL